MPIVPRATKTAVTPMTTRQTLATMAVMVTARAPARGESARPAARRATAPIHRRMTLLPNQPIAVATRSIRTTDSGFRTTCWTWRAVAWSTPIQINRL
jgi:hypothetical protein